MIVYNNALATQLRTITNKKDRSTAISTALGPNRVLRC